MVEEEGPIGLSMTGCMYAFVCLYLHLFAQIHQRRGLWVASPKAQTNDILEKVSRGRHISLLVSLLT